MESADQAYVRDVRRKTGRPGGRKPRGTRRCGKCSAAAPSRKAVQNLKKVSK